MTMKTGEINFTSATLCTVISASSGTCFLSLLAPLTPVCWNIYDPYIISSL